MDKIKGNMEAAVYITDNKYHILHFNKALKRVFPNVRKGDFCYEALCGENEPCRDCPLQKDNNVSTMFYNKVVQRWVEVNTGAIEWPEIGNANIVFCRAVQEENKNLFYNLTSVTAYDELYEINLTNNTYKILCHVDGKYEIPAYEGCLSELLADVSEHMIHPDDREIFLEFWDLDKILERLKRQTDGQGLSGQFRKKLVSGGYCWVDQRAVPLLQGDSDDKIIMCFIQDIDQKKRKENEVKKEKDTRELYLGLGAGLYRRSEFLEKAEDFLKKADGRRYCLMAIDIEHFKLFNEWYGRAAGDKFLANIGVHLKEAQERHQGIAGYMGDDDFCIILPDDKAVIVNLQNQILGYVKQYAGNAGFLPAFGIYEIDDKELSVSMMYDRAVVALASIKGNFAQRVCWYDSGMMQKMEQDHKLLTEIQQALDKGQFTFYAQPKCDMKTGKIVGLESLVRWVHPERGIISPGDFIPLLESNGFITNLDLYIWEEVCKRIKGWIDTGHKAIPISVNVSRIDLYTMDVVAVFKGLTEKYGLEPRLLEVEITESAYAEEHKAISEVVSELKKAGFTVLMDDFGSGYSSLNMLKDVNVDILKIDMKFLEADKSSENKGMEILEAIIRMAHLMKMRMIAEGVETKEQVDMLLDIGCAYGQGYYFYRPMPVSLLETLLADENNVEFAGIEWKSYGRITYEKQRLEASQKALAAVAEIADNDIAFMGLTQDNRRTAESIFAQMTPGGMIGGYCEEGFPLYFANYEMVRLLGYDTYEEFAEAIEWKVENTIHPDDRAKVAEDIGPEYFDGMEYTTSYRMPKKDGTWFWTLDKGKVIRAEDGRLAIISACTDISEPMEIQRRLKEDNAELLKQNEELHYLNNDMPGGYHRCLPLPGYPFSYLSNRFLDIFGYTREEIKELFDDKFMNMVHPDDREKVDSSSVKIVEGKEAHNLEYRMRGKNGYIWVFDQSKYMETQGTKCIQGVVMDVTETVQFRNQMMLLREYAPENIVILNMGKSSVEFVVLASGLYRKWGWSEAEYQRMMTERQYIDSICGQDYERMDEGLKAAIAGREDYHTVFQKEMPDGSVSWLSMRAKFISESTDTVTYLFVYGDVTNIKKKEQELWLASEKLESILRQASINCWDWNIEQRTITLSDAAKNELAGELFPMMKDGYITVGDECGISIDNLRIPDKYRPRIVKFIQDIYSAGNHESHQCEFPINGKNGELIWIRAACETICNGQGRPVRAVGYYMDITEQKKEYLRSKEDIKILQRDALTGLYNRQAAIPKIKRYLEEQREGQAAMIMFDMDDFKMANDVFGHAYGDAIISKSAEKLKGFFRENDIVCRIGGDEFLVLCKNIREEDIEQKLGEVIKAMKISCKKAGREIIFTASAGYAMIPEQGEEFDELYRNADVALFTSKMSGKGTFRKYSPSMKEIRYELVDKK